MKRPANSKGSLKNLSASINSFNNSFPDANKSAGVVGLANEKSKFSASQKPKFNIAIMVEELQDIPSEEKQEVSDAKGENNSGTNTNNTAPTTDDDLLIPAQ